MVSFDLDLTCREENTAIVRVLTVQAEMYDYHSKGREGEQSRAARIAKEVLGTEIDPKQPYGEVSLGDA